MSEGVARLTAGEAVFDQDPRDFWGGLVLIALAVLRSLARTIFNQRHCLQSRHRTAAFASVLAGIDNDRYWSHHRRAAHRKIPGRGPVFVIVAILCFAGLIRPRLVLTLRRW
jgi:hypothetical protein